MATEPRGVGPGQALAGGLPDIWLRRSGRARLLWPVSLVYRLLLALRETLFRMGVWQSATLPVPVVVVGNVAVGGGGKTPTVLAVVKHLQARGWTPGIVSRGYGGQALKANATACLRVEPGPGSASSFGDEPVLLARASGVPVVVGRRRAEAAHTLLAQEPQVDIIVSDDGMQHWAMARDLTLVLFDERGLGNGWLLPAGLLREPWPPAPRPRPWQLSRPDRPAFIVLTRPDTPPLPADGFPRYNVHRRLSAQALSAHGTRRLLADVVAACTGSRTPLCAWAGIAQPERFFQMLQDRGVPLAHTLPLPDHASAHAIQLALLDGMTRHPDAIWLCTEKDAVKCFDTLPEDVQDRVWAVPLEQEMEPAFWDAIDGYLAAWRKP